MEEIESFLEECSLTDELKLVLNDFMKTGIFEEEVHLNLDTR